jgi:hypothetical protein
VSGKTEGVGSPGAALILSFSGTIGGHSGLLPSCPRFSRVQAQEGQPIAPGRADAWISLFPVGAADV